VTTAGRPLVERGPATEATLTIRQSGTGASIVELLARPLVRVYVNRELRGLKALRAG
jgi:hypothetical protein